MKKLFLIVFIACFIINYTKAQSPFFKNYNTSDDLPSSETYCVVQDKKGYMWFATDRGVAKFDGYNLKVFTTDNGLPDNTVFEFFVADDNTIWFKTVTSEIGYIKNDTGYSFSQNDLIRSVLPSQMLRYVLFTNDNHVWFTRERENSTKIIDINDKSVIDSSKNIKSDTLKRIYINKKGEKVVTGNLVAKRFEIFLQETDKKIAEYSTADACRSLFIALSKTGKGFFIYTNYCIFHVDNGRCEKILSFINGEVLAIFADDKDDLWVGYRSKGFERFEAKNGYKKKLSALNKSSISSIYQDTEGGFWFASLENGVYYLTPHQLLTYAENDGLPIAKTFKIVGVDGDVLAIMSDYKPLLKKRKEKYFRKLPYNGDLNNDLEYNGKNIIYTVGFDAECLKDVNKQIVPLIAGQKKICIGKKYIWSLSNIEVTKYSKDGSILKSIPINTVARTTCFLEVDDGDLLIGTVSGLYLYHKDSLCALNTYNPLLGSRISDIKSYKNNLLLTTIGKGVIVIKNYDFAHPVSYTTADGLPSMMCNVVLAGKDSLIWIGTNRGLCMMRWGKNKTQTTFVTFDINDGLASNEVSDLCFVENDLLLATSKGITVFPLNSISTHVPDVPVYIEAVLVNGKPINNYTLPYNQNNISISFTGLRYHHAGKLQYKYRMKGDTNWYFTTSRTVVFNNLRPGDYEFEVGVIKPNGQLNAQWAKYSFSIQPPFWQTWWFITLAVIFSITVLVVVINKIILVKRDELYKKAQLDRKLAQLELEAIKAQINPHFIYNCLNSIQYFNYKNDSASVKKYFGLLARLIRQTMQFSHETFITLDAEVNYLSNYLELEKIRFKEKLNFHVTVANELHGPTLLPAMLVQPYVENALKHGISNLETNGQVWVNFSANADGWLLVTIEDNGPGLQATANDIEGIHFGNRLTKGRVASYNQLFGLSIGVEVISKEPERGLKIKITIPPIANDGKGRKNIT